MLSVKLYIQTMWNADLGTIPRHAIFKFHILYILMTMQVVRPLAFGVDLVMHSCTKVNHIDRIVRGF